ncbi:MAG: glycosyltransferase, partial [Oscillospiraceae bacterium]|nr:glycosyltransferase [Oscillospiraceae bacterium]
MNEPVRILCVFGSLERGGAETMCMNIYRRVDRERLQFDFVKHTPEKCAYEDEIKVLGGRVYTAPRFKLYNIFSYKKWWENHLKAHPEHKVIHGHYFTISKFYFQVAKKMGRVTVGHCHVADLRHTFKASIRRLIDRNTENYCDFCLACSKQSGGLFFTNREFTVVNNGIEPEKFHFNEEARNKMRKEFGIEQNFVIGVVGSIKESKNPFETIKIFKAVLK